MNTEDLIKSCEGTVIDVRSPLEFMGGSVFGAVNIPLHDIPHRMDDLKKMKSPLILCCASGYRSGQAEAFLSRQGLNCLNGGSWMDVNYLTAQNT